MPRPNRQKGLNDSAGSIRSNSMPEGLTISDGQRALILQYRRWQEAEAALKLELEKVRDDLAMTMLELKSTGITVKRTLQWLGLRMSPSTFAGVIERAITAKAIREQGNG